MPILLLLLLWGYKSFLHFPLHPESLILADIQAKENTLSFSLVQTDSGYFVGNYQWKGEGGQVEIRFYGTVLSLFDKIPSSQISL